VVYFLTHSVINFDALLMDIKSRFFKSVNAIFDKLGSVATEDVIFRAVERLIFFNRVNRAINYFNRALTR